MKCEEFDYFEKVLVRDHEKECWLPAFIRGEEYVCGEKRYITTDGMTWKYAIQYEGNEKYTWTTDRYLPSWKPKRGDMVAFKYPTQLIPGVYEGPDAYRPIFHRVKLISYERPERERWEVITVGEVYPIEEFYKSRRV